MRILLTNNDISLRSGTELYLCEVARELQARGHQPMCFSLEIGPLAEQLTTLGIPVSDDLRALPGPPDVIHGQHFIETTLAAMTYRTVPVISFCHGPEAWQESACQLPNVVRWVVVDEACRRRLVEDEKIAPERITTLLNHFDEKKFSPRCPLPSKPKKALIVSNYLDEKHPAVEAISAACDARGIDLEMAGIHFGKVVENMGTFLADFDLVFAKARTAIEALAVGCAVIQIDYFGAGRMVRSEIFEELRPLNFGYRSMMFPITAEHLGKEIDLYNAGDAAVVSQRIREEATLNKTITNLLSIYETAITQAPSLKEYDPATTAADFWRFHLQLSKLPMNGIYKSPLHSLRLPSYPIAAGELAACWENLLAPHNAEAQKNKQANFDAQTQTITDLKIKLAASKEKLAQSKKQAQEQISQLQTKLVTFREKNAKLKARLQFKPQKTGFLQRMRRFFASN